MVVEPVDVGQAWLSSKFGVAMGRLVYFSFSVLLV